MKNNVTNLRQFAQSLEYQTPELPINFTDQERTILLTMCSRIVLDRQKGLDGLERVLSNIRQIYRVTKKTGTVKLLIEAMDWVSTSSFITLIDKFHFKDQSIHKSLSAFEQQIVFMLLVEHAHLQKMSDHLFEQYLYDIRVLYKHAHECLNDTFEKSVSH